MYEARGKGALINPSRRQHAPPRALSPQRLSPAHPYALKSASSSRLRPLVELSMTRESRNIQPSELRFRARLTEEAAEMALVLV